jgi:hypothetical protein
MASSASQALKSSGEFPTTRNPFHSVPGSKMSDCAFEVFIAFRPSSRSGVQPFKVPVQPPPQLAEIAADGLDRAHKRSSVAACVVGLT